MQTKIKYKMTNREKRKSLGNFIQSSLYSGIFDFALLPMAVSLGLSLQILILQQADSL